MEAHFPAGANSRLMNLMTIARYDQSAANDAAISEELRTGDVTLLVPAEPPDEAMPDKGVTFTHVYAVEGERTLVAFTSEAALRTFAKEDLCCMGIPGNELLRVCMGGIDVILLDPMTPNEVSVCLTPFGKKGQ
jgi:hypothetical protein